MNYAKLQCAAFVTLSVASVAMASWPLTAAAQTARIRAQVPALPPTLPILKLDKPEAPARLIPLLDGDTRLSPLADDPELQRRGIKLADTLIGQLEGGHLKAVVDLRYGEAQLYPTLSKLEPMTSDELARAPAVAERAFALREFIPQDDTTFRLESRGALKMGRVYVTAGKVKPVTTADDVYLAYFAAQRTVAGVPVEGSGSRARIAIGARGKTAGMFRNWRRALVATRVAVPDDPSRMLDLIAKEVGKLGKDSGASVTDIQLVYFDGDGNYIQPVFRFAVETGVAKRSEPALQIGYVPVIDGLEPVPGLEVGDKQPLQPLLPTTTQLPSPGSPTVGAGTVINRGSVPALLPTTPSAPSVAASPRVASKSGSADAFDSADDEVEPLRVGRFVANFDEGFSTSQIAKWENSAQQMGAQLFAHPGTFEDTDHSHLTDQFFDADYDAHLENVDVALFEAHGDLWKLYTRNVADDPANLDGLVLPVNAPRVRAADWILHSCLVVPSSEDLAPTGRAWYEPWQSLMGDVRSVVGYRTRMFVNDGTPAAYAKGLVMGASVSSWFSAIASLNLPDKLIPSNLDSKRRIVAGRASAVFLCGHTDDPVWTAVAPAPATCLENWYMPDCSPGTCSTAPLESSSPSL